MFWIPAFAGMTTEVVARSEPFEGQADAIASVGWR